MNDDTYWDRLHAHRRVQATMVGPRRMWVWTLAHGEWGTELETGEYWDAINRQEIRW